MTWKEFKEAVEKEGVVDTDLISWIDVMSLPIEVKAEEKGENRWVTVSDGI